MNLISFRSIILTVSCVIVSIGLSACSGETGTQDGDNYSNVSGQGSAVQTGQVQGALSQIEVHTTPYSIGVRWNLNDSTDHNESFTLEYFDEVSAAWFASAPARHVNPDTRHGADRIAINQHYWASSLVNLQADHSYEIRAVYTENGERQTELFTVKTKGFIKPVSIRDRFVVPQREGDGKGDGSQADPYRGLQTAADSALPGDTFHIAEGRYQPFQINVSGTSDAPIVWLGPIEGEAIIDGQGAMRGVVTIESNTPEDGIAYNVIQGLTIKNGNWGIDASYSHHIEVFNNTITSVDYDFFNRRTTNLNHDQQVCGNVFIGQTDYPGGDRLRKGIRIKGSNNITCFNTIRNFADCISTDEEGLDTRGSDIFGNDVSQCSDDGIEIDHDNSNMRVWQNRVSNSKSGISAQPLIGGPAYVFRNVIINVDERTIKLHNNLSGLVLMHNTGFRSGSAFSDDSNSSWPNSIVKNNVFWGDFYAFANLNMEAANTRQIDYNAFGSSRADGGNTFWIGDNKYPTLTEVQAAGLLPNSVPLILEDFAATAIVAAESVVELSDFDLSLSASARALNTGETVDHLNLLYVSDGMPDMGAYEQGFAIPLYGVDGFAQVR